MAAPFHELKVAGIVQETADARSFLFEVPSELRAAFGYRAGQFLTFELPWNGMRIRRCYSLASAPELDVWHKVTVKRVEGGRGSNLLHDTITVGSTLLVQPPDGRFVLRAEERDRPLTLFAGGSGITPVVSIVKAALVSTRRHVRLVYANRDACSIIFRDELALLAERHPGRLEVHHHLDAERGFLDAERIASLLHGRDGSDYYVCGPSPFMDLVEAALEARGVDDRTMFFERFVSPLDPDRRAMPAEPRAPEPAKPSVPSSFTIVLDGKTHLVPYEAGETLLAAAKKAGVDAPCSCEEGYCGSCMAMLRSGKVEMQTHEALSASDVKKGWVLACQSRAASAEPITLDYDQRY